MKKILIILLLFLGFGISNDYYAQTGGRKKEKSKRPGNFILTRYRSRGHADNFAKGNSGRRGLIARIFKKPQPAWVPKSSGSRRSHFKANQYLFTRARSKGKLENDNYQYKQNTDRTRNRVRGNQVFKRKKYKSR